MFCTAFLTSSGPPGLTPDPPSSSSPMLGASTSLNFTSLRRVPRPAGASNLDGSVDSGESAKNNLFNALGMRCYFLACVAGALPTPPPPPPFAPLARFSRLERIPLLFPLLASATQASYFSVCVNMIKEACLHHQDSGKKLNSRYKQTMREH